MKTMKRVLISVSKALRRKKGRGKARERGGVSLTREAVRKLQRQVDFARRLDPKFQM